MCCSWFLRWWQSFLKPHCPGKINISCTSSCCNLKSPISKHTQTLLDQSLHGHISISLGSFLKDWAAGLEVVEELISCCSNASETGGFIQADVYVRFHPENSKLCAQFYHISKTRISKCKLATFRKIAPFLWTPEEWLTHLQMKMVHSPHTSIKTLKMDHLCTYMLEITRVVVKLPF